MPRLAVWFQAVVAAAVLGCGPGDSALQGPKAAPTAAGRATDIAGNLHAMARLYGYVRWFHPTDAAAGANWRVIAATGVASVRGAQTLGELRAALLEQFGPLAPHMDLWIEGEPEPRIPTPPGSRDPMVFWQHEGYVGTRLSLYSPPYGQVRVGVDGPHRRRFVEAPDPTARVEVELVPGLHLRMPMVLTPEQAEYDGDVPRRDPELAHAATSAGGYTTLDVRQGAVVEVWNVFRHFYPYQDAVPIEWSSLLGSALVDAEDDVTVDDAAATLWRLVHALEDGHGFVGHREIAARGQLPIRVELVDGQPIITGTADPTRFSVGDIVDTIDGIAVAPRVSALAQRLSGSPQWRRFRAAAWDALAGPRDAEVTIGLRRGAERLAVTSRYSESAPPRPPRPAPVHRFDDGVYYVDLTRAHWDEVVPVLGELAAAPGVVFDMRGYPTDTHRILAHLLGDAEDATWMQVPRIIEPDGRVVGWEPIGWHIRPQEPQIRGEVVFLIDAEAISFAESVLGYVEAHHLGTLVGSPTAGANGDIVRVDTLGGFFVVFTGMKVTRHDGSRFHVDGVRPGVAIAPSGAGLRAGRDEVLEAGLSRARERVATTGGASARAGL